MRTTPFGNPEKMLYAKLNDLGSCCVAAPKISARSITSLSLEEEPIRDTGHLKWGGTRTLPILKEERAQKGVVQLSSKLKFCNKVGGAILMYDCEAESELSYRNCSATWVDDCPVGTPPYPNSAYALALGLNGAVAAETLMNTVALFFARKRVPEVVMRFSAWRLARREPDASWERFGYVLPNDEHESLQSYIERNFRTVATLGKAVSILTPMVLLGALNFYSIYAREQARRATVADIISTFEHTDQCEGLSADSSGKDIAFTGGLKDMRGEPINLAFIQPNTGPLVLRVSLDENRFKGYLSYSCENNAKTAGFSEPVFYSGYGYIDLPTEGNLVCEVVANYYNISSPSLIAPGCKDTRCDLGYQMYKGTFKYWGNEHGFSNCVSSAIAALAEATRDAFVLLAMFEL